MIFKRIYLILLHKLLLLLLLLFTNIFTSAGATTPPLFQPICWNHVSTMDQGRGYCVCMAISRSKAGHTPTLDHKLIPVHQQSS